MIIVTTLLESTRFQYLALQLDSGKGRCSVYVVQCDTVQQ